MRRLLLFAALTIPAAAQWTIQTPATAADLRGIDNVGKGIAWASGTEGTVLRTEDNGYLWQRCTIPPNAEHLDFRGIQAFDANTAIVMSSGKGDLSRLYKTTDGCQTWKLLFTNPDKEGFWDGLVAYRDDANSFELVLVGDPVDGRFATFQSMNGGRDLKKFGDESLRSRQGEGLFAASNSSLLSIAEDGTAFFGTGGPLGARLFRACEPCTKQTKTWQPTNMPMFPGTESAGIFSIGADNGGQNVVLTAVGGDYKKPDSNELTAAFSLDYGEHWRPATTLPHGYRSAVAYDAPTKTWITVGPNGTDISTDDGRNWRPLKPSPPFTAQDTPDADQHWNALSLPFVVGPHGRIGILNPTALKSPTKTP